MPIEVGKYYGIGSDKYKCYFHCKEISRVNGNYRHGEKLEFAIWGEVHRYPDASVINGIDDWQEIPESEFNAARELARSMI
jgi:hypothetical protein